MCPCESFVRFSSCSPQRTSTRAQRGPGSSLLHEKSDSSLLPAHPMRMQAASDKHPSTADWLLVATPGIIWGASFLFIAEGLRATAPNGVSFIRIVIGFLTLSCFPAARKPIDRSAWPGIVALSVLWFAFPLSMFPFAEQRVSSALTGMLNATTPLFVATVAAFVARKAPSMRVTLGL